MTSVPFELSGGPACGAVVTLPLKPAGEHYLIETVRENSLVRDVWVYGFANRSNAVGVWVLEFQCYVGHRGLEQAPNAAEEGGAK